MLRFFTRLPTSWIHRGGLRRFGPQQVWGLKVIFGLAIIWGSYERRRKQPVRWFPASLSQTAEASHLSRNDALEGIRQVADAGIVEQRRDCGAEFGVHPRTSAFSFSGDPEPYFAFPHFHVAESGFLGQLRRGQVALAALKIYLLLGTFRNNRSGMSFLSYGSMGMHGAVHRTYIRAALSVLYEHQLLVKVPPAGRGVTYSQYFIQGLVRPAPAQAGSSFASRIERVVD